MPSIYICPMKIGLFGYGKMGATIEKLAVRDGHHIVWRINRENRASFTPEKLREADVAIEFSRPEAALANIRACLDVGLPVVSGTTGWLADMSVARQVCEEKNGSFFWASNFSVGVNLFFLLNQKLADLMANQSAFRPSLTEIHHIHKLDAPSGTAVTLADDLVLHAQRFEKWVLLNEGYTIYDLPEGILGVEAIRQGEVPGTHIINWASDVDYIEIKHVAHSREGFAAGAILAASWLIGKKGVFGMSNLLAGQ